MKQKLLLLMAFTLLVTLLKAQGAPSITLGQTSITRIYQPGTSVDVAINVSGLTVAAANSDNTDVVEASLTNDVPKKLHLVFKKRGSAMVTVTTDDADKSATLPVTINPKPLNLLLDGGAPSLTLDYDISLTTYGMIPRMPTDFALEGVYPSEDVQLALLSGFSSLLCSFQGTNAGPCDVRISGYTLDGADKGNYSLATPTILTGEITKSSQETNLGLLSTVHTGQLATSPLKFDITVKGGVTPTYEVIDNTNGLVSNPTFTAKSANTYEVSFVLLKAHATQTAQFKIKVPSSTNYNAGEVLVTLRVTPPSTPNIFVPSTGSWTPATPVTYGGSLTMPFTTADNAVISYTAANPDDVVISGKQITFKKARAITINVTAAQTVQHAETTETVTVTVAPKTLTLTGITTPVTKPYNGDNIAAPPIIWKLCTLTGVLFNDDVELDTSSVVAQYNDVTVTAANKVTITGLALGGTKRNNYTLDYPSEYTGKIVKANQPQAFAGRDQEIVTGIIGDTWPYSALVAAAEGADVTKVISNATALEDDDLSQVITFKAGGNYNIKFTAPGDDNYNPKTITINFKIAAANVITTTISNLDIVTKQEYKSTAQTLNITAVYYDGAAQQNVTAQLKFTPVDPAIATVTWDGSNWKVNYLKAGTTTFTVDLSAPILSVSMTSPLPTFTVTVDKRDLPINGLVVNARDYSPNDRTVPVPGSNWATQSVTPISGDDVQYLPNSATHPTLIYEDDNAGNAKKILIQDPGAWLTGNDAGNYNLVVTTTGKVDKISQGDLGLGADPVKLTVKYGSSNPVITPTVLESAATTFSSVNTAIAEFPTSTSGTVKINDVGTVDLYVNVASTTNYVATTKIIELTIEPGDQVFSIASSFTRTLESGPFQLIPNAKETPVYTFSIENGASVISVAADGTVTPLQSGTAKVKIVSAPTAHYAAGVTYVDITILDGVTITGEPVSVTICEGTDHTFSVTATGAGILTYQWMINGNAIAGATQNSYSITNARAGHAGVYTVRVSNGSVTQLSANATLTVNVGVLSFNQQLSAIKTVCADVKDTLRVSASGPNITYQWYYNDIIQPTETDSAWGFNKITKLEQGKYKVVVSGICPNTGTAISIADSCQLKVVSPLPSSLTCTFTGNPNLLVNRSYPISIGEGTLGYEGVTKYIWTTNNSSATFAVRETTTNSNTLTAGSLPGSGDVKIEMEHLCGNNYYQCGYTVGYGAGLDAPGNAGMKVYPNPVTVGEPLTIDLGEASQALVYIYNVTGSLVYNTSLVAPVTELRADLKPGIYMIKVLGANNKTTLNKFIVK